jgi:hypothetical protein
MAERVTTKFKPLFLRNYWQYNLHSNQYLKPSVWQCAPRAIPLPRCATLFEKSIPRHRELLSECRSFDVQSRISAPQKSQLCSGELCLWGIPTEISHTCCDQAKRQANQCRFHRATNSPNKRHSTQKFSFKRAKYRFCTVWPLLA